MFEVSNSAEFYIQFLRQIAAANFRIRIQSNFPRKDNESKSDHQICLLKKIKRDKVRTRKNERILRRFLYLHWGTITHILLSIVAMPFVIISMLILLVGGLATVVFIFIAPDVADTISRTTFRVFFTVIQVAVDLLEYK